MVPTIKGTGVSGNELPQLTAKNPGYALAHNTSFITSARGCSPTLFQVVPLPSSQPPFSCLVPGLIGEYDATLRVENGDLRRQKIKGFECSGLWLQPPGEECLLGALASHSCCVQHNLSTPVLRVDIKLPAWP
jgi:hypothetical protein